MRKPRRDELAREKRIKKLVDEFKGKSWKTYYAGIADNMGKIRV